MKAKKAEQDARANAGTCHASCDGICFRNETKEWVARCGTRRAKSRRGSSLTFGKGRHREREAFQSKGGVAVADRPPGCSRRNFAGCLVRPVQEGCSNSGLRRKGDWWRCDPRRAVRDLWCSRCAPSRNFRSSTSFKLSDEKKAEQGARANAGTCHASCDGICFRSETTE